MQQATNPVVSTRWSSERTTRLVLGLMTIGVLGGVTLLTNPRLSAARPGGPSGSARLPGATGHAPVFRLDAPSRTFVDASLLGGHTGIPMPPPLDAQGRSSLGVIVGPALFVWVYGGSDGVRYSVVDLGGQVLAAGLTGDEVYGAFPELQIPEMQFGPDGQLCEPIMWAGDADGV